MTNAYIKLSTQEYPRHIGDIEIDPAGIEDYASVIWSDMPEFDKVTQRCYETTPINIDGVWTMQWTVRDATQEEIDLANKPFNERFPL